jgi:hypothetical protein
MSRRPGPLLRVPLLVLAALSVGTGTVRAGSELLGGFHSVAGVRGVRALWVNPAAVGSDPRPAALAEVAWVEEGDEEGETGYPTGPTLLSVGASTDHSAYGWQKEWEDSPGVADWTLTVADRRGAANWWSLGLAVEVRGGEGTNVDATAGALVPLGRSLTLAGVAADLFERDTDGRAGERLWRTGIAWRPRDLSGRITWDTVWENDRVDETRHWFAIALGGTGRVHLEVARSDGGDWSGSVEILFRRTRVAVGGTRPDGGLDRLYASLEWRGSGGRVRRPFPG